MLLTGVRPETSNGFAGFPISPAVCMEVVEGAEDRIGGAIPAAVRIARKPCSSIRVLIFAGVAEEGNVDPGDPISSFMGRAGDGGIGSLGGPVAG